jgi:hypothetical protein
MVHPWSVSACTAGDEAVLSVVVAAVSGQQHGVRRCHPRGAVHLQLQPLIDVLFLAGVAARFAGEDPEACAPGRIQCGAVAVRAGRAGDRVAAGTPSDGERSEGVELQAQRGIEALPRDGVLGADVDVRGVEKDGDCGAHGGAPRRLWMWWA